MMRCGLRWAALVALCVGGGSAGAVDCRVADDVVLQASSETLAARAYWLGARHLAWPGQPPTGDYRLYHSAAGTLRATQGQPVAGAETSFDLQIFPGANGERERRYGLLDAAVHLRLNQPEATLRGLLRGQALLARVDDTGRVLAASALQRAGALDALYSRDASARLGARPQGKTTEFALWAPSARRVEVCVFAQTGGAPRAAMLSRTESSGVWRARLPARSGDAYVYFVEVWVPGHGWMRNRVTDPYALSLTADSARAVVLDPEDPRAMPPGWRGHARPAAPKRSTDMTIYELHVRDFSTMDASVPERLRGKYLAFTQPETQGMRHLRRLAEAGLGDVHLLPVFDLASVPERGCRTVAPSPLGPADPTPQAEVMAQRGADCFNWGYDPWHYSAPEGSYATDPDDGLARVREFRAMVQALHAAGLRVGMDVVYNHTMASGQARQSLLDRIVPGYYHRLDAEGKVTTSTCCANTATEHRMMAKLMNDSVLAWAKWHAIDSFRFDLMGHQPRDVMLELALRLRRELGREIPLIGEGWNFGEVANGARFRQAIQGELAGSGIATFSDRARDAIRGGSAGDAGVDLVQRRGYINGLGTQAGEELAVREAADRIRLGLAGTLRDYALTTHDGKLRRGAEIDYGGQPAGYAQAPGEVVNYVENHDNLTLFDVNALRLPATMRPRARAEVQVLGLALGLLSQGIPYLHAGSELLRSKSLDRNSYDSGDWFNRLDWSLRDNGFGAGLPPAPDNQASWPQMRPVLENPRIKPAPEDVAFSRDAVLDLLRIRAASPLFRLDSAAEVSRRLRFFNTGPTQKPWLIAAELDGAGLAGEGFERVVLIVNVADGAQSLENSALAGRDLRLHPVQAAATAGDPRLAAEARFDAARGVFTVPARSAVVFVASKEVQ